LIVVGSIFFYANLQKNKKTWPDIIQETKKAVVVIKTPNSIGSGFLVSSDGLIITNSHVIQNNSDVEVIFNSKESKKASIIKNGIIPLDIAILKVAGENYDFLTLADSNNCKEGEDVVAIGAPLALSETVTKGIISNCNRQIKAELSDIKYIQTDVPVNPGNSGGPLINSKGEVLGILTWKIAEKDSEGLNFAIAINVAKDFMNGKLVKLEETVRQMEEERLQREQQEKQIISYLFYYTYNVLSSTWMNEYTSYYNR
jgi:S1-C subfamily serine protease